jgi:GMP synthase (glutamine-hydrolysing)
MGLDPRFEHWVEQWPEALAEVGSSAQAMRTEHARCGPGAVAAGRRMVAQWLSELAG